MNTITNNTNNTNDTNDTNDITNDIDGIGSACNDIIALANDFKTFTTTTTNNTTTNTMKVLHMKAHLSLLNIKSCNRKLHDNIDKKKHDVDDNKNKVDRLRKQLDSLLYTKAELKKSINICKDLDTPYLSIIENDVGRSIALREYPKNNNNNNNNNNNSSSIIDTNTIWNNQCNDAINKLNKEMNDRKELQKVLDDSSSNLQNHVDTFDKKRKLVDSLPDKLQKIKDSTNDIKETLIQAKDIVVLPLVTSSLTPVTSVTEIEMTT